MITKIPPRTKLKREIVKGIYWTDSIYFILLFVLVYLIATSTILNIALKIVFVLILALVTIFLFIPIGVDRGYNIIVNGVKYMIKPHNFSKTTANNNVSCLCPLIIEDNQFKYSNKTTAYALKIETNSFHTLSETAQMDLVYGLANALSEIGKCSILSLNEKIDLSKNIKYSEELLDTRSVKYYEDHKIGTAIRHKVAKNLNENMCKMSNINDNIEEVPVKKAWYIILYHFTEEGVGIAQELLEKAGLLSHKCDNKQLAILLKYCYGVNFKENDFDKIAEEDYMLNIYPDTIELKADRYVIDGKKYRVVYLDRTPYEVDSGWLYPILNMTFVKSFIHIDKIDDIKATKQLEKAIDIKRDKLSKSMRATEETRTATDSNIIEDITMDIALGEALMNVNCIFVVEDEGDNMKVFDTHLKSAGFGYNNFVFQAEEMCFNTIPYFSQKLMKRYGRAMPATTIANGYPFIGIECRDTEGIYLGKDINGVPALWDNMVHRKYADIKDRTAGNTIIFGKTGAGKSYNMKNIVKGWASEKESKMVILDIEDEYRWAGNVFNATIIDVGGNTSKENINPLQIFPRMDSNEESEAKKVIFKQEMEKVLEEYTVSDNIEYQECSLDDRPISSQLLFLQQFHILAIPGITTQENAVLSTIIEQLYKDKNITNDTDFREMKAEQFPVYQEVYDTIINKIAEFEKTNKSYELPIYKHLQNYIKEFCGNGSKAHLWGKYTTIDMSNDLVVLSFRNLLASGNNDMANAQLFLLCRYIDIEMIKNKEYCDKNKVVRPYRVIIDEVQKLINEDIPEGYKSIADLCNRVRKYNGSIILATQNIKSFTGTTAVMQKACGAMLNAMQYKMIFALEAGDIDDLMNMYSEAMHLTTTDRKTIERLQRGQMLFMLSALKRTIVNVEIFENEEIFIKAM